MPAKRILLVDDQRSVTSLLRSALETLGRDYIIVEVPSGEEALLEIGRGGADLVVLDVRLPGITGLEVARRARRLNSKTPLILISGAATAQMEQEALSLGVLAFLKKPISVDMFLPLAQRALGEQAAEPEPAPDLDQPGISERLSTLRRDLGADAVYLVDMQARVNMRAGDITRIDLDPVLAEVMASMSASLKVSRLLHGLIPANVVFFDGDDFDIYAANVGQFFAIVIIFNGDRGAGQMGPVMRYGRQCADDLLNSLVMLGVKMDDPVAFAPRPAPPAAKPAAAPPPAAKPATAAPARPAKPELIYKAAPARPATGAAPEPKPVPAPPPAARPAAEPPPAVPEKPLTEADLQALDEALAKVKAQDANAFWDAFNQDTETDDVRTDAITFEDAEKMGLVKK